MEFKTVTSVQDTCQGPRLLSYEIPPKLISNSRIHLIRLLYTPGNSNVKIIVCSDKWKNEMFASCVILFFLSCR